MAATSSTSSSSSSGLSGNRMAGLMSGLETEELVKSLASNTKNRINAKKQKLQTLQWKQEGYRNIIKKISSFQDKYLKIDSPTSIKANAVMNKFKAEASDSRLTATASSSALEATYHIKSAEASTAASLSSTGSVSADKISLDFSNNVDGKEYTVKMTLDGTTRDVKFTGGADVEQSKENFLNAINDTFKDVKTSAQSFKFNAGTSDLVFDGGSDGVYHTFSANYNSEAIGLSNSASSRMAMGSELGSIAFAKELKADSEGNYKLNINGTDFTFNAKTTISDMVNTINSSTAGVKMTFSSVSQSFKLESTSTGTAGKIEIKQDGGNLANALFNTDSDFADTIYGTNGRITVSTDGVNYRTYTSATNEYTFDGTTINIGKIGNFDSSAVGVDEITIETKKDTSAIKDVVVNFVNDYNQLIADLYKEVKTSRPKSNGSYYDPLTEEQEEEMDKDEIDKWNEQAKEGLLFQDSNITKFLSSIRSAMSSSFDGMNLSSMGVNLTKAWTDNGKLEIDEDKLDAAIKNHGDAIAKFFTDPDNGLAAKVNTAIDRAVSTKKNSYGYLTNIAGVENTNSEKKNSLYSQISGLQSLIETLETRYQNEMERYWKQFTSLETYMSNMQSQSSIFASDY